MINFYNQVPVIYSAASRDFQYLSWLINIVLNSVKHNVDDIYNLPNNIIDSRLSELLALTLGFKVKRSYDRDQLIALVSILPSILKCKGTERALRLAGEALVKSSHVQGSFDCTITKDNQVELIIPRELVDITLLTDLLPYILPAGLTCKIKRETRVPVAVNKMYSYYDEHIAKWFKDVSIEDANDIIGLATIHDGHAGKPGYSNYTVTDTDTTLNTGLLGNSIIPVLDEHINEVVEPDKITYAESENVLGKFVIGSTKLSTPGEVLDGANQSEQE